MFMICQPRHRKWLARRFHAWLDCFTVNHLCAVACLLATVKRINEFSWYFQDRPAMTQGTIWNILGMMRLTFWVQGLCFYFLGPRLRATLWNGWLDMHELFRIWTQAAVVYTVLCLLRLFHAPQNRRGGGLRSRGAAWLFYVMGAPCCIGSIVRRTDHVCD